MLEQVSKTRQFHRKQGFSLDKNLRNYATEEYESTSAYILEIAEDMLSQAMTMESQLNEKHDPRFARTQLMIEELGETILGLAHCDEQETLDGLSDLAFVTIGTAIAFDLPIVEGLDEVCDSNLTKAKRSKDDPRLRDKGPDYKPPNLKRVLAWHRGIDVKAIRTNCMTDVKTDVTCHCVIVWHEELESYWVKITKGGVTGFESCEVNRIKNDGIDDGIDKGTRFGNWCACAGTPGSWDTLYIPEESMKEIIKWINL